MTPSIDGLVSRELVGRTDHGVFGANRSVEQGRDCPRTRAGEPAHTSFDERAGVLACVHPGRRGCGAAWRDTAAPRDTGRDRGVTSPAVCGYDARTRPPRADARRATRWTAHGWPSLPRRDGSDSPVRATSRVRVGDVEVSMLQEASTSGSSIGTFVCAHGAGGNMNDRGVQALAKELRGRGLDVVRFNFPYSEKKSGRPDPMP